MTHAKGLAISLAVVAALGLGGCGNTAQQNNTPTVESGGDTEGNNDLSRYTNADWLFQNYFGEYGLPDELKAMMMPELKMLANGFALQQAKGEDVNKSISELNHAMMMARLSGKLKMMVNGMIEDYDDGLYAVHENNNTEDNNSVSRTISMEAQQNIEQAKERQAAYAKKQEELVKKYNLPYAIPGRTTKTIVYSSAMKSSSGKDGGGSPELKFRDLDSWDWYKGDFFWTDGAGGAGHMGVIDLDYNDDEGRRKVVVIDAMPGTTVQSHRGMTHYFNSGHKWSEVEGWWYSNFDQYNNHRYNIINHAYRNVGHTPYNIVSFKGQKAEVYCSKLVWNLYYQEGVDLDKDGGWYVWPRDIATEHGYVKMFNSDVAR